MQIKVTYGGIVALLTLSPRQDAVLERAAAAATIFDEIPPEKAGWSPDDGALDFYSPPDIPTFITEPSDRYTEANKRGGKSK